MLTIKIMPRRRILRPSHWEKTPAFAPCIRIAI